MSLSHQAGPNDPLLLLQAHTFVSNDIKTYKFWYTKKATNKVYQYRSVLTNKPVEELYDDMAENYGDVVTSWGYCMPGATADAIVKSKALTKSIAETRVRFV